MIHDLPSIYAGMTVRVRSDISFYAFPQFATMVVAIQDYYDRVTGNSWTGGKGFSITQLNMPVALYAIRQRINNLPPDDEVLWGVMNGQNILLHVTEIEIGSEV